MKRRNDRKNPSPKSTQIHGELNEQTFDDVKTIEQTRIYTYNEEK